MSVAQPCLWTNSLLVGRSSGTLVNTSRTITRYEKCVVQRPWKEISCLCDVFCLRLRQKNQQKQVQNLHWNHSLLRQHYDCSKEVHYNCIKKAHYPQAHTSTSYNATNVTSMTARESSGIYKERIELIFRAFLIRRSELKLTSYFLRQENLLHDVTFVQGLIDWQVDKPMHWINLYWEDILTTSFSGFFLLPRERTLVAAGHVTTTCDNEFLIGVGLMYYLNMS